jgi:hypothetical protein
VNFDPIIEAQLAGLKPYCAPLVEFRLASQTIRCWSGVGPLDTLDGRRWEGVAKVVEISGLDQAVDGVAPVQTLTVSGVDPTFAAIARGEQAEYYRRPLLTFIQFFYDDGPNLWQVVGEPIAMTMRQMETIRAARLQDEDGQFTFSVSINAETPFTTRTRPRASYWTDSHQKVRFPGDNGLKDVAGIDGREIVFPDFGSHDS